MTRYRQDAERFVSALVGLGALDSLGQVANAPVTWRSVLIERLLPVAPWKARVNDLRKLVEMQNKGLIARIYTHNMKEALRHDLRQLRRDHGLR